jgi:transcription elongation factor GreB
MSVSRAFVDESASENSENLSPELRVPLPPGAKNYVTPAGASRLQAELGELLALAQPRLPEVERRIQYLSRMRAIMEVVPPPTSPPARAVFGTAVTVRDAGGVQHTYRIVGVDESDPGRGALSWISPVARALTGRKPGEQVRVSLPAGEQLLTILSISSISFISGGGR